MTPSPLPTIDPESTLVESGEEQLALIGHAIASLSSSDQSIFMNQTLYHAVLMIYGYGLPALQLGGKYRAMEIAA